MHESHDRALSGLVAEAPRGSSRNLVSRRRSGPPVNTEWGGHHGVSHSTPFSKKRNAITDAPASLMPVRIETFTPLALAFARNIAMNDAI